MKKISAALIAAILSFTFLGTGVADAEVLPVTCYWIDSQTVECTDENGWRYRRYAKLGHQFIVRKDGRIEEGWVGAHNYQPTHGSEPNDRLCTTA